MDIGSLLAGCVIFLFAENGTAPIGTAFVVGYPLPNNPKAFVPLVVTAKHVIGDQKKVIGRFTGRDGGKLIFILYDLEALKRRGDFWEHADGGVDIVVFRAPHFADAEYQLLPKEFVAGKDDFRVSEIQTTDRIVFPSLLLNFMGTTKNYPVIRDGTIALMPDELVPITYQVGSQQISTNQELIFLDATSVPGASGSPVFLWPGPRLQGRNFMVGGTKPLLLGIMHGFYNAIPREVIETSAKGYFQENSRVAIVFPSWRLKEILDADPVKNRIESLQNIGSRQSP